MSKNNCLYPLPLKLEQKMREPSIMSVLFIFDPPVELCVSLSCSNKEPKAPYIELALFFFKLLYGPCMNLMNPWSGSYNVHLVQFTSQLVKFECCLYDLFAGSQVLSVYCTSVLCVLYKVFSMYCIRCAVCIIQGVSMTHGSM